MAEAHQCPCCSGQNVVIADFCLCRLCHHRWSPVDPIETQDRYVEQVDRNALPKKYVEDKLSERLAALTPYLVERLRVIEIGCAEGALGALVKSRFPVDFTGVEISRDAGIARMQLDHVCADVSDLTEASYDLLLAFHVLEHLADINQALTSWRKLLSPSATMVLEVPNQAGHPWLVHDANKEHVHQFDVASLTLLLRRHGFRVTQLDTGKFESPCYPDSIRVIARLEPSSAQRSTALMKAIETRISEPFDVFAVGGDFDNYLRPILASLAVECLFDNQTKRHRIEKKQVKPFSLESNDNRPILISSVRYEAEIREELILTGVPADKIVCLSEVLLQVQHEG